MKVRSFLFRALPNKRKSQVDAQDRFVSAVPGNSKLEVRNAWEDDNFGRQRTGEPDPLEPPLEPLFKSEDSLDSAALEPNFSEFYQVDAWQRPPVGKSTVGMTKEEMHGKAVEGLDPSLVAEVNRQAPKYCEEQLVVFHQEMRYKAYKSLDKSVSEAVRHEVECKAEMHGKAFNALDAFMVEAVKNEVEQRELAEFKEALDELSSEHEQQLISEFQAEMRGKAFKALGPELIAKVLKEVQANDKQEEALDELSSEHEQQLISEFKAEMRGKAFKALDPELVAKVLKEVQANDKQEEAFDELYSEHKQQLNSEFKAEMHGKAFKALDPELIAKVLKEVQANDEQEARTMERANVGAKMRIEPDVVESNRARDQFFSNLEQALDSGALEKVLEELFLEEEEEEEPQAPPILKARGRFKRPGMLHRATLPGICEFEDSD